MTWPELPSSNTQGLARRTIRPTPCRYQDTKNMVASSLHAQQATLNKICFIFHKFRFSEDFFSGDKKM